MSTIRNPESIREILHRKLDIPNYQRPYKWKVKNVVSLISDIEHERKTLLNDELGYRYRIGSIILHKEGDKENIVDGQQRLLTICLILRAIADESVYLNNSLFYINHSNKISLDNLKFNYEHIERYFKNWEEKEKESFAEYLLDKCEMIIIDASNISEAFQLFDSQNARGKILEPADLLKAYHLRYMTDEHEKKMCVQRWEDAIDRKVLHYVLSEIIYRCRCWLRRDFDRYDFGNDYIDEFKGVDINIFDSSAMILPYMEKLYVMSQISAYSINEPIVNGKRFFDYVDHYISLYETLFPSVRDRKIKKNQERLEEDNNYQDYVRSLCYYSPKMYRVGDSRLRNVLFCLLLSYYDKFGGHEYEQFFKVISQYVYRCRVNLTKISRETIRKYVLQGERIPVECEVNKTNHIRPFEWIENSYQAFPSELRSMLILPDEEISRDILNENVR